MKTKTKPKKMTSAIESVTVGEKSIDVMFTNVRLIYDGISEVVESSFKDKISHRFVAGLEIQESPELRELINITIRSHFRKLQMKGWSGDVAVQHFDEKKFKASQTPGYRLIYPSAPAEEVDGGFRAKGKFFVNPDHESFYAGCYVDAKVAFVANLFGTIVIKDYLNGIRFVADGEPITGASDPWEDSQSKQIVSNVRTIEVSEEAEKPKKRAVGK